MVSPGFESLKRACYSEMPKRTHAAPALIASHEDVQQNSHAYRQSLSGDGVYVYWSHNKVAVLPNAVFGGHTRQDPAYVMVADHFDSQCEYIGRIPGVYYPQIKSAVIVYKGVKIQKKTFQLLLHDSYIWSYYTEDSPDTMISAGEGLAFCSKGSEHLWWDPRHPGELNLETKNCTIFYENYADTFSYGYFVLRRAC